MPPRSHIGPYAIVRELGRGGMGVVYLADDPRLGRQVAIKALPEGVAADADRLARLRAEARIVAQLNHPHIAQIHHLVEDDGATFLVLEYVPGRSLGECIDAGLETDHALAIMSRVARGLEAAHARGVIHRDLKPENVRVTDDGTPKILDFGIALAMADAAPSDTTIQDARPQQADGRMIGTPGYMAPEQCRGERVDARADVFAFGCVLYECLTGRRALDGDSNADRIVATLTREPDFSRLPDAAPPVVASLVRRCVARDLEQRIQSIADARVLIDECLGRQPRTPAEAPLPAPTPTNLPRSLDRFIGRVSEIATLRAIVDDHPLVTLTGAGGSGKSRLAVELARGLLDRYPDGVWIAELAPMSDGRLIPSVVAEALGVTETAAGASTTQRIAEHLTDARALLIIDNCEHVLDATRDLTGRLLESCRGLRIVATSREPLGLHGEHAWRVPSLRVPGRADDEPRSGATPTPRRTPTTGADALTRESLLACESVALFVDRARDVRPAFELTDENALSVAEICRRLDGIPLAVELAAARVKVLSPEDIARRLHDRFRLLRAGPGRTERHQTLRAAVDWSYRALTDEEKRSLRSLSIFAGGCTLEAATRILTGADTDVFETLDVLTALVDKSLVQSEFESDSSRYRLLETVRQFAAEELQNEGELDLARERHLEFFHALAARAAERLHHPDAAQWLDRLESDHDNLVEAIVTAPDNDRDAVTALSICGHLFRFWAMRAHLAVGAQACETALARPGARHATPERVRALNAAGGLAWQSGDLDRAERLHQAAREISLELGDSHGRAISTGNLANVVYARLDFERAMRMYEEVLEFGGELGETKIEASCLANLASVALDAGDTEAAARYLARALDKRRELEDPDGTTMTLLDCARLSRRIGDIEKARDELREALDLSRSIALRQRFMYVLDEAALLASSRGDFDRAARWIGACEAIRGLTGQAREQTNAAELQDALPIWQATLGLDRFDGARSSGRSLAADEALDEIATWLAAPSGSGEHPARPDEC